MKKLKVQTAQSGMKNLLASLDQTRKAMYLLPIVFRYIIPNYPGILAWCTHATTFGVPCPGRTIMNTVWITQDCLQISS